MKRFFLLGITLMISMAMLMTACKKDEVKTNGNNNNTENPGGGGDEGGGGTTVEFVDLGLSSGTMWKTTNETGDEDGFYTYDEAVSAFGDKLPTMEQFHELVDFCDWLWMENGYKVTGPNGNSIFLPAAGYRSCEGDLYLFPTGNYWSSTPDDSDFSWILLFGSDVVAWTSSPRCQGHSVRLVQD